MPRTFQDAMADDADAVFLNADKFAREITLSVPDGERALTVNQQLALLGLFAIPNGDRSATDALTTVTVSAIVDFDNLDAVQGLGLDTEFGRRIEEFGVLELAASVDVQVDEKPEACSYATIDGERWNCVRILGRDEALQSVAILRQAKITTRRTAPRP